MGVEVLDERTADRGATRKALLRLGGSHVIETVLMGYRDRVTACVSSQAGCAMGCTFCATGQMGLLNNLTAVEIAAQAVWARREADRLPASTMETKYLICRISTAHLLDRLIVGARRGLTGALACPFWVTVAHCKFPFTVPRKAARK